MWRTQDCQKRQCTELLLATYIISASLSQSFHDTADKTALSRNTLTDFKKKTN
jgi:hypothetical protein